MGVFGSLETEHNNNSNNKYLVEWSTMVFWSFEYIKRAAVQWLSHLVIKKEPASSINPYKEKLYKSKALIIEHKK